MSPSESGEAAAADVASSSYARALANGGRLELRGCVSRPLLFIILALILFGDAAWFATRHSGPFLVFVPGFIGAYLVVEAFKEWRRPGP
jgi:hypothetical protein